MVVFVDNYHSMSDVQYLSLESLEPIPVNSNDLSSHLDLTWDNVLLLTVF
jgi:hypothetical protein